MSKKLQKTAANRANRQADATSSVKGIVSKNTPAEATTNTATKNRTATTTIEKDTKQNTTESAPTNLSAAPRFKELHSLDAIGSKMLGTTLPSTADFTIHLIDQQQRRYGRNYISDEAITRLQEGDFREVRPAIRGKKVHFELGIEGRLGTSMLLKNQPLEAANKKILLCPTGAAGVNFQYYWSKNDAFVAGAYPYSTSIQCWGKQAPNKPYEEIAMSLSFVDVTLGYQRILLRYNGLEEVPARIYARLNIGMGLLAQSDTRINQRSIQTPNWYKNVNWSAGFAIGNLHQMQRFVLDYGLMSNIGLNNFVTGTQPNVLPSARIVNIGAYMGVRYLFTPRKAPSKKQRQFDWSAPFYIEEPQF